MIMAQHLPQAIEQITAISLHYGFFLERQSRTALKLLHMLSQGKCLKQSSHIEYSIACKLKMN